MLGGFRASRAWKSLSTWVRSRWWTAHVVVDVLDWVYDVMTRLLTPARHSEVCDTLIISWTINLFHFTRVPVGEETGIAADTPLLGKTAWLVSPLSRPRLGRNDTAVTHAEANYRPCTNPKDHVECAEYYYLHGSHSFRLPTPY